MIRKESIYCIYSSKSGVKYLIVEQKDVDALNIL